MHNIFSFKRFALLLKKEFAENARIMLYSFTGVIVLMALYLFYPVLAKEEQYQNTETVIIFVISLFFFGSIAANFAFSKLSQKEFAINSLTLPASSIEKFTAKYIVYTVLFTSIYCFCFWILKQLRLWSLEERSGLDIHIWELSAYGCI